MDRNMMINVGLTVSGVAIGFGVGYFVANKKAEAKWSKIADDEIEDVKKHYRLLRKEGEYADPRTATDAYIERLDELDYRAKTGDMDPDTDGTALHIHVIEETTEVSQEVVEGVTETEEAEPAPEPELVEETVETTVIEEKELEVRNVFDNPHHMDEFDAERDPSQPYPISVEEFMVDEQNFDKIPLIYFAGDGILADDREQDIPDIEGTIGQANLEHWLENLEGNSTLYIRHEEREADFEISYDPNSYAHAILGMKEEYEGSSSKVRPFKMRDDG